RRSIRSSVRWPRPFNQLGPVVIGRSRLKIWLPKLAVAKVLWRGCALWPHLYQREAKLLGHIAAGQYFVTCQGHGICALPTPFDLNKVQVPCIWVTALYIVTQPTLRAHIAWFAA